MLSGYAIAQMRNGGIPMFKPVAGCFVLAFAACSVHADSFEKEKLRNWHQWRGPEATGVAPLGKPPTEWSETKNIKWKVEIPGRGSASPIIWGDRIFVLTAIKTERKAEDQADQAARRPASEFRLIAHTHPLLAQRDERPESDDRPRDGERRGRGRGDRPGGGFGRGLGGRFGGGAPPTNFHQFEVLCLDRKSGDTIWRQTASELVPHEGHHQTGSFASSSPITDGKMLYASFGSRGIFCFDLDGNLKWQKDLGDMKTRMSFGEGSSPALQGDTLVVPWDQEDNSFIVALDANTGNEKWRMPREEVTTWATPLIINAAGRTQVVTSGSTRVRSYDLKDGKLIWECGGLGSNPIACPVVFEGLAIAMSGHRDPAGVAVPLSAKGDVTDTDKVAWQIDEITPYVSSPLLYGDTIYFVKSRNAIVSSVAARTGEPIINQKRLPDMDSVYASPVGADGRVYFCSREGTTVVLKHAPEFEVLATNILDETIDASPAIVGNEMFIRGEKHLYCIAE
jgi:outer membrane protein assembly factor BamB